MRSYVITGYMTQMQQAEAKERRRKRRATWGSLLILVCTFGIIYVLIS